MPPNTAAVPDSVKRDLRAVVCSFDGQFIRRIDKTAADDMVAAGHASYHGNHVRLMPTVRTGALKPDGSNKPRATRLPSPKGAPRWRPQLANSRSGTLPTNPVKQMVFTPQNKIGLAVAADATYRQLGIS